MGFAFALTVTEVVPALPEAGLTVSQDDPPLATAAFQSVAEVKVTTLLPSPVRDTDVSFRVTLAGTTCSVGGSGFGSGVGVGVGFSLGVQPKRQSAKASRGKEKRFICIKVDFT